MTAFSSAPIRTVDHAEAALAFLAAHGFNETTVEQLADSVGISRSTFFRRFGSKEDVIYADHYHGIEKLETFLSSSPLLPEEALVHGVLATFQLLTRNPDAAQSRANLLRNTVALREREHTITYRYERVISDYLNHRLPEQAEQWINAALSSALVAVHNDALRRWITAPTPLASGALEHDIRRLLGRFGLWEEASANTRTRVVVASYDVSVSPAQVLQEFQKRFEHPTL